MFFYLVTVYLPITRQIIAIKFFANIVCILHFSSPFILLYLYIEPNDCMIQSLFYLHNSHVLTYFIHLEILIILPILAISIRQIHTSICLYKVCKDKISFQSVMENQDLNFGKPFFTSEK